MGIANLLGGDFGKVAEAGRVYFPLDFETSPQNAVEMLAAVKGDNTTLKNHLEHIFPKLCLFYEKKKK